MSGFVARPSGDFAPAGDLLFAPPKSRQKALPCETAPVGVPCDARSPGPRPTHFATLRSNKGARSQKLMRAALAPRAPALLGGLEGEAPNSHNSQTRNRAATGLFNHTPFEAAEERRTSSPFAQRTSRTDSRRLFEQSVAARVRRGASGLSTAGNPKRSEGRGGQGGALCLLSGGPENRRFRRSQSESPAGAKTEGFGGAKSRHGTHAATRTHA